MIRTLTLGLALAGAVGALAAPAGARPTDLIPPEARDGSTAAYRDLRSPDARDAARPAPPSAPRTDLRSPDARDAAVPRDVVVLPMSGDRPAEADGFDWGDAAMGSGVAAALLLLGGAGTLTVLRARGASRHAARTSAG
jgi:hypothetical protein